MSKGSGESAPESSLLNNIISTKISCVGSYICSFPLGYPLDGIMQVEEEEEENNSDNETYTIEEDVRQRRKARGLPGSNEGDAKTTKSKRSFPRPGKKGEGEIMLYSKNDHSHNDRKLIFKTNYRLMQVKNIAEHSAILWIFIKLPFVIKIFVLSIFEWPFYQDFIAYEL